jgi:hypothetical protein
MKMRALRCKVKLAQASLTDLPPAVAAALATFDE